MSALGRKRTFADVRYWQKWTYATDAGSRSSRLCAYMAVYRRSTAVGRQIIRGDTGSVLAHDGHLARYIGVAAYPRDRHDRSVRDDRRTQRQNLALHGTACVVAKGYVDHAVVDRNRADIVVDDFLGGGQTGGAIVRRQGLGRSPGLRDRGLRNVSKR